MGCESIFCCLQHHASTSGLEEMRMGFEAILPSLLPYFLTSLLPYFLTSLLPYFLTSLLPYFLTSLLPYFLTSLLPYFLTSLLPYFLTSLLPYFLTSLLPLSFPPASPASLPPSFLLTKHLAQRTKHGKTPPKTKQNLEHIDIPLTVTECDACGRSVQGAAISCSAERRNGLPPPLL